MKDLGVHDESFLFPGTICEWPEDGPGSGKGPYGHFACKHCGRGHTEHGLGSAYKDIVAKLGVPEKDQHRICKIPRWVRFREDDARVGLRERKALKLWHDLESSVSDVGTLADAYSSAGYDPLSDTIAWRGVARTLEEINNMPEMYVRRQNEPEPWSNTHRILLEQEIASIQSRIDMLTSIADARATRGVSIDAESADAKDFYQRLRQTLISMRRPIGS